MNPLAPGTITCIKAIPKRISVALPRLGRLSGRANHVESNDAITTSVQYDAYLTNRRTAWRTDNGPYRRANRLWIGSFTSAVIRVDETNLSILKSGGNRRLLERGIPK